MVEAGELKEIKRAEAEKKRTETRQAKTIDEIARLAVERGYNPMWVAQRMKHIGYKRVSFKEIAAAIHQAKKAAA